MNSNFILLNKTYQTIDYINKLLINFPKKEVILKQYLEKNMYNAIENLFLFNINDMNRKKDKNIKDYIVNISMLNYLIQESFLKKYISYKQSIALSKYLLALKNIAFKIMKGLTNDKVS